MPFNNTSFSSLQSMMDFIRRHGEYVNYFQAMKCTCSGGIRMTGSTIVDANRSDPNCQACHGIGLVWLPKGEILGLATGIIQQKELLQAGIAAPGDLVFSPNIGTTLGDYDKITFTWPEGIPYEGDLITRSSTGATDKSLYSILGVTECITVDPTTGNVTTYNAGTDFTFNGRTITWVGTTPAANAVYSIKYNALMEWIVFPIPQPRKERGTDIGQKVLLRKKHLVSFGQ